MVVFSYQGFSNGEVVEKVKQDKPEGCAGELYVLTLTFLSIVLSMLYSMFCKCGKVVHASINNGDFCLRMREKVKKVFCFTDTAAK